MNHDERADATPQPREAHAGLRDLGASPRAEGALLCPPGAAHVVPCDLVPGRHLGTHNVNEGP